MKKNFDRTDWITIEISRMMKNETTWTEIDFYDGVTKCNLDDIILQYVLYITQAKNGVTEEKFDNAYKVLMKRVFETYEDIKNVVNKESRAASEQTVCTTYGFDGSKRKPCTYRLTLAVDTL